jgi:hypothetical protein
MITGNFDVRPGKLGLSSAAFFHQGKYLNMSHTKEYDTKEITVIIWVYIRKLMKKGIEKVTQSSPALFS